MLLLAALPGSGHEGSQLILRPTITEGLVCPEGRGPGPLSHMDSHSVSGEGGAAERVHERTTLVCSGIVLCLFDVG